MNLKRILIPVLALSTISPMMNIAYAENVINVKKYIVDIDDSLRVPYDGVDSDNFVSGFKTGFGSAITFKEFNENNEPVFYALTDRGPNGDSPNYQEADNIYPAKFFPSPSFTPSIGVLTLTEDGAHVDSMIELQNKDGKNLTGLPLEPNTLGSTGEIALDLDFNVLGYDNDGVDTEGIAIDREGNIWICDEYGPFLMKFDKDGNLLEKYAPGDGLPEVLKYRIANRGFEGLTVTPSGKVLVAVQSVLDIEGETKNTALFTRIVEFDPENETSKTYAYPVQVSDYNSPASCKIGDIYAIDDQTVLVIEQGKDKDKNMQNLIYKVDLSNASDITDIQYDGKELEYVTDQNLISNISFAQKELLVDLREQGWTAEKAEGLTVLPDKKTLIVINDNDFEIKINALNANNEEVNITDYTYDAQTKQMSIDGNDEKLSVSLEKNEEESEIWLIELSDEIKSYSNKEDGTNTEDVLDLAQQDNMTYLEDKENYLLYIGVIGAAVLAIIVYIVKKIGRKH